MTTNIPGLKLDFSKSPTIWKFLHDKSFVRGLIGPVGSGKSYACCAEIFKERYNKNQVLEMELNILGLLL